MEQLSTYSWHRAKPELSSSNWRRHAGLLDGLGDVVLRRSDTYDVHEAQRRARAEREPLLSPHGFFRRLPNGRNSAAIEFVEKFGPLEWQMTQNLSVLVFAVFWQKHLRYIRVLELWEQKDNEENLRNAFANLLKDLHQIDWAEEPPKQPHEDILRAPFPLMCHRPYDDNPRPWDVGMGDPDSWLASTSFDELREKAIAIFHSELNFHINSREPRWYRTEVDSSGTVSFKLFLSHGTLWQYIWELTGLETTQVTFWRICPACNTIFYPRRSDQFYCTSREQILASKRKYARGRRQAERQNRLLSLPPSYRKG